MRQASPSGRLMNRGSNQKKNQPYSESVSNCTFRDTFVVQNGGTIRTHRFEELQFEKTRILKEIAKIKHYRIHRKQPLFFND